jgi:hypothetical protein
VDFYVASKATINVCKRDVKKVGVTGRSVAYCLCGYVQPFSGLLYRCNGCNNNSNLHTSLLLFTCCPCLPHNDTSPFAVLCVGESVDVV